MRCNLLNLPAELHLNIVQELLRDGEIGARTKGSKKDDSDDKEKQDEPIKIFEDIEINAINGTKDDKGKQDERIKTGHLLINWSCTCSYFRELLAPEIFKTAKLVNSDKSGSSLEAVVNSHYNIHVKELHFIGSALENVHSDGAAFSDTDGILPRNVHGLLCNLQRFPSLERLSIEFDYNLESLDLWIESIERSTEVETTEQVLEAEASVAWRALMSRTYSALTQNKSPHFKHLEIRNLMTRKVSTFSHTAFHKFLNHLEQFTISIYGEDTGRGQMSNTTEEYSVLMGKLDEYFFNHLANVTTLSVRAPRAEPLGLEGMNYISLTLKPDQMLLLTTLHLDFIFASPELIDFLVGHKATLKKVTLNNYYADTKVFAENSVSWSKFFNSLFSACFPRLRCFELMGTEMRLPTDGWPSEELNAKVRSILQQDPGRILFPYAFLDPSSGKLLYDERRSFEAFVRGRDQRSWNRLMGLVEKNAKEAAKSGINGVGFDARA